MMFMWVLYFSNFSQEITLQENPKSADSAVRTKECIQTRYADLTNAIKAATPAVIGDQLVQAGVISKDIMDFETGLSSYGKASKIMSAVSTSVNVDPKSIKYFIKVLRESNDPSCRKIGQEMAKASKLL